MQVWIQEALKHASTIRSCVSSMAAISEIKKLYTYMFDNLSISTVNLYLGRVAHSSLRLVSGQRGQFVVAQKVFSCHLYPLYITMFGANPYLRITCVFFSFFHFSVCVFLSLDV